MNGLSKMLSVGKFTPNLGISDSWKYDGLGVSDFENLDLKILPMGLQFFIRKLIRNEKLRNLPLPESAFTIVM